MLKTIGSSATFLILSVMALFTCILQIIVNYLINHVFKNEVVNNDNHNTVKTKEFDDAKEDMTTFA